MKELVCHVALLILHVKINGVFFLLYILLYYVMSCEFLSSFAAFVYFMYLYFKHGSGEECIYNSDSKLTLIRVSIN